MFRECSCKQESCTLKYAIKGCNLIEKWTPSQRGTHPLVMNEESIPLVIKSYGLSKQILELVDVILDNNRDAKAKEILVSITLKRKSTMQKNG